MLTPILITYLAGTMHQKKHLFTLRAAARLKQRKKIDALFTSGQKLTVGEIRLVYHVTKTEEPVRFLVGVGVSKRYFKKAVDRNLIKRRLREAIRLERPGFLPVVDQLGKNLDLFVLFTGKQIIGFDQCQELIQAAFKKLTRKLQPRDA